MKKTPLILLPGTLCDEKLWSHQIMNLSDIADVTVGNLSLDDSISGMATRILEEAPRHFALAGLSMGGTVALEIIRQAPERVKKLALLDTNPYPSRTEQINNWSKFIQMANSGSFMEVTENYLLPLLTSPDNRDNPELINTIYQMAESVGKDAMIRQMTALKGKPDYPHDLHNIHCHSLIVYGKEDAMVSYDAQKELQKQIPDSHLVVVEAAGHLSSLEQPQAVTALMRYWLSINEN